MMGRLEKNHFLFGAGILLKLAFGICFASYFVSDYFMPFIDYFLKSGFKNPYEFFIQHNKNQTFPYPALMLYIMALPKAVTSLFSMNEKSIFFDLFLFRLPLLVADLTIFFILRKWLKKYSVRKLIGFYWFSPVLIYITYIHGQLDVIPIALLFLSLNFLFTTQLLYSGLFLGLALATKTHVALTVPFFGLYLLSKNIGSKNYIIFLLTLISAFLFPNLPYIFDSSFMQMVLQNSEQSKLFLFSFSMNNLPIYLVPASLLLLFIRGGLLKNYNKDIFLMFLGFSFSVLLLFIPPMQGWYFWLIPFLVYFYMKEEGRSPLLLFALQGAYFLYFFISRNSDFPGVFQYIYPSISNQQTIYELLLQKGMDVPKIIGIVFTGLQAILLTNCLWVYKRGIESYTKHKITSSPFLIGIGGDSGVGKTSFSEALKNLFHSQNTTILRGDDMHKWQRGDEKWKEFTHLDPKANYLHKETYYLKKLKSGKKVFRRNYDHKEGKFTSELPIKPNNIIIFEGLHPFYINSQRYLYDIKIFIKPDVHLGHHWKIIRDMNKRGHSKEKILEQIKKRERDSKKYIETQSKYADIFIEPMPVTPIKNIGDEAEQVKVKYKVTLQNSLYLEPFLESLDNILTLHTSHYYLKDDKQVLEISGEVPEKYLEQITEKLIPGLQEIGINTLCIPKDGFGVLVLIIAYYIFEEADNAG